MPELAVVVVELWDVVVPLLDWDLRYTPARSARINMKTSPTEAANVLMPTLVLFNRDYLSVASSAGYKQIAPGPD
jgi:hypothetical protein